MSAIANLYGARPIKRGRRTKDEMQAIRDAILAELRDAHPQTVRQVFYRMVVQGVVPKVDDKTGYGTVQRLLVEMRMAGDVPFSWIADNTRWMRKPRSFTGLEEALKETAEFYRRDLWSDADVYVEVWCEKDALAGIVLEETRPYDVPLMVARGFASVTYLYNAARNIAEQEKPAFIYHFGDHDPSGRLAAQKIEQKLREFAPKAEIHFETVAVTPQQIRRWNLPTRPTKRKGNTHAKGFKGDSVELDSIPAFRLRQLVRRSIERHIDRDRLRILEITEESERHILRRFALGRLPS
jgi:hypothetical protein